jgi:acyl-CoA thioester hydrolase
MREYWRGSAEAWECDEMGHMNVRFWVRHFMDGIITLAEDIGCGGAFAKGASATLMPKRQHIKFMREARAGAPLFLRGGIVDIGPSSLTFYSEIVHSFTGEIGATAITVFDHIGAKSGRAFSFPARVEARAKAFAVIIPDHGKPRSITLEGDVPVSGAQTAVALGLRPIGQNGVRSDEVDLFGRLYPEGMIGRVSNAMPNFLAAWREAATQEMTEIDGIARKAGAAVLEYRLQYLAWPSAGDRVSVYSGLAEVNDKNIILRHLLLDPVTDKPWCVCEALAVTLDLTARKITANPPKAKAALQAMLIKTAP